MDRWTTTGLLMAGLGLGLPAHANDWTFGVDAGYADLQQERRVETNFDAGYAAHLDYWITPHFAVELNGGYANGHLQGKRPEFGVARFDRDWHSYGLGVRAQWPISDRAFVFGTLGASYDRIRRERFEITSTPIDDLGSLGTIRLVNRADVAPYVGLGAGWNWDAHWSSTVSATSTFGHSAFGCDPGFCDFRHRSRFDVVAAGLEYRF